MRLLVAVVVLALASAQHANFRRMSSKGTAAGVKADTGYTVDLMGYLWRKYRTRRINSVRHYEGFRVVSNKGEQTLAEHVALCMYAAFWYMHIYPTTDAIGGWEFGRGTGRRFSKTRFYACVIPVIMELAQIIDEIKYEDRLHPHNHGTGFLYRR